MTIHLYDTAAREKRLFEPQDPSRVTMYVCGPTVYNYAHIGNARPPIIFDVLRRLLEQVYGKGSVVYARNITDIEDKIIAARLETGTPIAEITQKYAEIYNSDTAALNVRAPDIEPWAIEHIPDMIEMIDTLIRRGYAYTGEQGVWFSVKAMDDYGKLSGRKLEDNLEGARVEVDTDKRDAADFALWKFAKAGEPDDAVWDSPWGKGRPGWHIECSAMAAKHLGKTIDIHGGGIDLQFPHHENEIAQSECAHGQVMANYWLHNGFLDMGGEKMSKSLGNVKLVHQLLENWDGEVLRFAMLSGHYRAPLDWTEDLLQQAKTTLDRIYGALRRVWDVDANPDDPESDFTPEELQDYFSHHAAADREVPELFEALCNDLNTPVALAVLSGLASEANSAADKNDHWSMLRIREALKAGGKMLGLLTHTPAEWEQGGDSDDKARIDALVQARIDARTAKDWGEADRIRDELAAEGVEIMDNPDGSTWRKI